MTVGLLLCDHLDPDVVERVGDYTDLFPAAFGSVGVELHVYDVTHGGAPGSVEECAGWITSGSRRSCDEDEGWIHDLHDLARELADRRIPHVGICFGHQLIARALGGEVGRAEVGWGIGAKTFAVTDPPPWLDVSATDLTLLMSHQDQVLRLPEGATLVATSDYCPVGTYRIEEHVFCVQGHPEFVPELSRALMEKRRAVLGHLVEGGLASLDRPLDHDLVLAAMADFLSAGA